MKRAAAEDVPNSCSFSDAEERARLTETNGNEGEPRSARRAKRVAPAPGASRRWLSVALALAILLVSAVAARSTENATSVIFICFCGGVLVTAIGARAGNPVGLLLASLFGVPLNAPAPFAARRGSALAERARWLARFLKEPPRGFNTVGAHVACGVIALKRELKRLCLREERASRRLGALSKRRKRLVAWRRELNERAARRLALGDLRASEYSRRAYRCGRDLEALDEKVLSLRLDIQREVVAEFLNRWDELFAAGELEWNHYESVVEQLRQPDGEPEALLPNGLVPGNMTYAFEYGMFLGRAAMTYAFIATVETSSLLWSGALFLLSLYVIEPVVQKLYISAFNLLLKSPGHKLVDLKRYIDTQVPEGRFFRVPITVPKFSSNPAWANLQVILDAATRRAGAKPSRLVPFALRSDNREVVLEFQADVSEDRLRRVVLEITNELSRSRAVFPLETRVVAGNGKVTVELLDPPEKIWDLVGEDASQAFIYLRRNLDALVDTLAHLGPKFQPVFVLVSNTKDADVVQYEMDQLAALQRLSDARFNGQVGFLYLLRGGYWYNFNRYLESFDASDKDFLRALPEFKRRLEADEFPGRSHLLALLGEGRSAEDFAHAFNRVLGDSAFYRQFDGCDLTSLPPELRPTESTFELLERARELGRHERHERIELNRELLLSVIPAKIRGDFFKKVGNDIAVQELLVAGRTKPTVYLHRSRGEHVQDPSAPNFVRVQGDFARYTGLRGQNESIHAAILAGEPLVVDEVPELGAIIDDKNEFGPGELEKGIAILLHPENRHIVIGVPRIDITLPLHKGAIMASDFILGAGAARDCHNASDSRSKSCVYGFSSAAYGKWLHRPRGYLAHYAREVLNPAHALSHDFQQSYFVAGAAGRLGGFTEALYGPTEVHAVRQTSAVAGALDVAKRYVGGLAARGQTARPRRVLEAFIAPQGSRGHS